MRSPLLPPAMFLSVGLIGAIWICVATAYAMYHCYERVGLILSIPVGTTLAILWVEAAYWLTTERKDK
jgi:hypothetical protein